jgi:hypothetical protein
MLSVMGPAEKVVAIWRDIGIAWDDGGASEEALNEVERKHRVRLPTSFRELWRLSDGTGAPDDHWLVFFQVSDLVDDKCVHRQGSTAYLHFADWRQSMASFALRLSPDDQGVVVVGSEVEALSASFDEFLELYLVPEPLWPPAR